MNMRTITTENIVLGKGYSGNTLGIICALETAILGHPAMDTKIKTTFVKTGLFNIPGRLRW